MSNNKKILKYTIVKEYSESLPIEFNIFSTIKSALFYIDAMDFSEKQYKQIISEL